MKYGFPYTWRLAFACSRNIEDTDQRWGQGAVFAVVPLVTRRMTGQIAGMAGAYGNVGAVVFLTVFSFVEPQIFFMVIGVAALITLALVAAFMHEPA